MFSGLAYLGNFSFYRQTYVLSANFLFTNYWCYDCIRVLQQLPRQLRRSTVAIVLDFYIHLCILQSGYLYMIPLRLIILISFCNQLKNNGFCLMDIFLLCFNSPLLNLLFITMRYLIKQHPKVHATTFQQSGSTGMRDYYLFTQKQQKKPHPNKPKQNPQPVCFQ